MRFRSTFFTLLIIFITCTFQGNAKKNNIRKYYIEINLAELSIIDSNYSDAISHYKKAFKILPSSSEKDIYNAAVLGYLAKDEQFSISNLNKLAHGGYSLGCLTEQSKWGIAVKNELFFKKISNSYDAFYYSALNSETDKRGQELLFFYEKDQAARSNAAGTAEMKYADSVNMRLLYDYIQQKGFPSFKNNGFFDIGRSSIYFNGTPFLMMWHWRGSKTIIDSCAYNALMRGDFDPKLYSTLMDMHEDEPVYFTMLTKASMSEDEEIKINQKRAEIYLESLSDYKKKLAYQKSDSWFILVPKVVWAYNRLIHDSNARANAGKQ
jgi:hypothetical protein